MLPRVLGVKPFLSGRGGGGFCPRARPGGISLESAEALEGGESKSLGKGGQQKEKENERKEKGGLANKTFYGTPGTWPGRLCPGGEDLEVGGGGGGSSETPLAEAAISHCARAWGREMENIGGKNRQKGQGNARKEKAKGQGFIKIPKKESFAD